MNIVGIREVGERSVQGVTRPFLCEGEDGFAYYVKGTGAGFHSLCCEWVSAQLALRLGLPVAMPQIVRVPSDLVEGSYIEDIYDLGEGLAFGSRRIDNAVEIRRNDVQHISTELKMQLLAFDWWICNSDRLQSPEVGQSYNPNLLWAAREKALHVIDHNNAFADTTQMQKYWPRHIFIEFWGKWDETWKSDCCSKWREAITELNDIWYEMPDLWSESSESTSGLTLEKAHKVLGRFETDPLFWEGQP